MLEPVPGRMKVLAVFIVGSMIVMFADGLMFDNYNSKPSMALMHMDMKPVTYADPAPPGLEEYWEKFWRIPTEPSDPDVPLEPEIIDEGGTTVKVYRILLNDVLHEIRPGVQAPMFGFNTRIPGPTLRVQEGDTVRVVFYNNGTDPHTIHWHGINNLTNANDGVPDITQDSVMPGEEFTYEFTAAPSGTKMYHCHVEAPHHINMGMFGALIVDPAAGPDDGNPFDKPPAVDHTMIFTEFDTSHGHAPLPGDMMTMGPDGSLPWLITPGRKFTMPFKPKMNEYMINGRSYPYGEPVRVREGDVVRLRLINLGSMPHSIHVHGHEFTVTHRDGFKLAIPFMVDTLLIGSAERYDVWFEANNPGIWFLHDHSVGAVANGYDPAGMMTVIQYEGADSEFYDQFLERAAVYQENIEHMDEDHGRLTPSTPIGGDHGMEEMGSGGGH